MVIFAHVFYFLYKILRMNSRILVFRSYASQ